MSSRRTTSRRRSEPSVPSSRVLTQRELYDAACTRLVDAVMAEDRPAAEAAFAEASVVLRRAADRVAGRSS